MECAFSEINRKLNREIEFLKKEYEYWKKECSSERRNNQKVRDKEREWFNKYEVIMCNLAGDHISSANESGFHNFEECINWFIEEFKKLKCANLQQPIPASGN